MKKIASLTLIATILLLVAGPALAGDNQTVWEILDPDIGIAERILWIGDDMLIILITIPWATLSFASSV